MEKLRFWVNILLNIDSSKVMNASDKWFKLLEKILIIGFFRFIIFNTTNETVKQFCNYAGIVSYLLLIPDLLDVNRGIIKIINSIFRINKKTYYKYNYIYMLFMAAFTFAMMSLLMDLINLFSYAYNV
jgi:hypothetical protein